MKIQEEEEEGPTLREDGLDLVEGTIHVYALCVVSLDIMLIIAIIKIVEIKIIKFLPQMH